MLFFVGMKNFRSVQPKSIKSLSVEDRPREKLLDKGRSTLTNSELLAIIIGAGNAQASAIDLANQLLQIANYNLNELAQFTIQDYLKIKGIGRVKAIALVAAFEIGRRKIDSAVLQKPVISNSKEAYNQLAGQLSDLKHEQFWVLYLNRAGKLLSKVKISEGGTAGTVVDPKLIFSQAINLLASTLILAHNHPSGNNRPSDADLTITKKIKEGALLLDLFVADHIIVCNQGFYSFADEGML
jgi:DNA repair protein RadC